MDNANISAGYLLRLVGFFAVAIGLAWAAQTLAFGNETAGAKLMWVIAAASMSGAGAGLIFAALGIETAQQTSTFRA